MAAAAGWSELQAAETIIAIAEHRVLASIENELVRAKLTLTLLQFFEVTSWPKVMPKAGERSVHQVRIDVGARMGSIWK